MTMSPGVPDSVQPGSETPIQMTLERMKNPGASPGKVLRIRADQLCAIESSGNAGRLIGRSASPSNARSSSSPATLLILSCAQPVQR